MHEYFVGFNGIKAQGGFEMRWDPYDYNIFSVPAKNFVRDFFLWDYLGGGGKKLVNIPSGPLVADYAAHLTDACTVTKFIYRKSKIIDYKVALHFFTPRDTTNKKIMCH